MTLEKILSILSNFLIVSKCAFRHVRKEWKSLAFMLDSLKSHWTVFRILFKIKLITKIIFSSKHTSKRYSVTIQVGPQTWLIGVERVYNQITRTPDD